MKENKKECRIAERMASFILQNFDIDENICKYCKFTQGYYDVYDCVECLIDRFEKKCYWEQDDVCVNDKSEHCADFIDNVKCGGCLVFQETY